MIIYILFYLGQRQSQSSALINYLSIYDSSEQAYQWAITLLVTILQCQLPYYTVSYPTTILVTLLQCQLPYYNISYPTTMSVTLLHC